MAVNAIYRLLIHTGHDTSFMQNTLFYRVVSVAGAGDSAADLAAAGETKWAPLYKAYMSDEAVHQGCSASRVWPLPPTSSFLNGTLAGAGQVVDKALPPADAIVITKKTGYAGRAYRGRIYLPGLPQQDFLGGTFDGAYPAPYTAVKDALKDNLTTLVAEYEPVLYKEVEGGTVPGIVLKVIDGEVKTILRTQRRRQRGVGI